MAGLPMVVLGSSCFVTTDEAVQRHILYLLADEVMGMLFLYFIVGCVCCSELSHSIPRGQSSSRLSPLMWPHGPMS